MVFAMSSRIFVALAAIAAIEGVTLVGYGLFEVIEAARYGATGPAAVSNPAAITIQIAIFLLFGAALVLVSRGWVRRARWVRGPFIVAQLFGLVVGVPLIQASGSVERFAGIAIALIAVAGVILTFTRPVMAVFSRRD